MNISSDVNVVFAYADSKHIFHRGVLAHIAKKQRDTFIIISKLKSHFIYTYKDYLVTACIIIEKAIRDERHHRSKSPSKTYKPNVFTISASINALINDYLEVESAKFMNFNISGARDFINLLLTDYSIPKLYEDDEALANFREKYNLDAEKQAEDVINRFVKLFNGFECMNIEDYTNYELWLEKIKKSKQKVFENKRDTEDMRIAAEFLVYNEEKGKLGFFTCDKNCHFSILAMAKEYNLKLGKMHLVRK